MLSTSGQISAKKLHRAEHPLSGGGDAGHLSIDMGGKAGEVDGGSGGIEGGPGTNVGADAGELGGDLWLGGGDHVEELLLRGVQAGDVGDHGSRVSVDGGEARLCGSGGKGDGGANRGGQGHGGSGDHGGPGDV